MTDSAGPLSPGERVGVRGFARQVFLLRHHPLPRGEGVKALTWESAYGKAYQIQVSNDAITWTTVYATTTSDGGTDNLTRITVDGSSNNTDWLKVEVHRSGPEVVTWEQIPYR